MSIDVQDAIDEIETALLEFDWTNDLGVNVIVDKTPERSWTAEQLTEACVLHIIGGGTDYAVDNRSVSLSPAPSVAVSVLRYVGADDATGEVRQDNLADTEAIQKKMMELVRDAMKESNRFGLLGVEKPVRYDRDMMRQGIYLSPIVFTIHDSTEV